MLLWVFCLAYGAELAVYSAFGEKPSVYLDLGSRVVFPTILASWVIADAKQYDCKLCYDFDAFLFFAWPIALPYYLFRTRGWRAFITILCFCGNYCCVCAGGIRISNGASHKVAVNV